MDVVAEWRCPGRPVVRSSDHPSRQRGNARINLSSWRYPFERRHLALIFPICLIPAPPLCAVRAALCRQILRDCLRHRRAHNDDRLAHYAANRVDQPALHCCGHRIPHCSRSIETRGRKATTQTDLRGKELRARYKASPMISRCNAPNFSPSPMTSPISATIHQRSPFHFGGSKVACSVPALQRLSGPGAV